MSDVYRNGRFEPDDWRPLGEDEAIPADGRVIVPYAYALAEREALAGDNRPLGVLIQPGDDVEAIGAEIHRFSVVAVAFPAFTDGRGYSTARILREHMGFAGEIRAVGNVLIDQIAFMRRSGIDAFVVTHEPTRRRLATGNTAEVELYLQPASLAEPAAGGRPWGRRKAS
jgi:uncharacterized protein (DUF934 family)